MAEDTNTPVQYVVLEKSLVGNEIFEAGQTCSYAGLPAENLQPTCDVGRARYQEYLESNRARLAALQAANSESAVGDPAAFAGMFAKALAEANSNQSAQIADAVAVALARVFPNGTGKAAVKEAPAPTADTIA